MPFMAHLVHLAKGWFEYASCVCCCFNHSECAALGSHNIPVRFGMQRGHNLMTGLLFSGIKAWGTAISYRIMIHCVLCRYCIHTCVYIYIYALYSNHVLIYVIYIYNICMYIYIYIHLYYECTL